MRLDESEAQEQLEEGDPESLMFFLRQYVEEGSRLSRYLQFCRFGFDRLSDEYVDIHERIYRLVGKEGDKAALFEHLAPPPDLVEFAREQHRSGFALMHELGCVRLWSLLERVIDVAALHLLKNLQTTELSQDIRKIEGPLFPFLEADKDSRAEYILSAFKQRTGSALKAGVGRFEVILKALGCVGEVHPDVRRGLMEFSEARNVIVHRGGQVDAKFSERCPWVRIERGQTLKISSETYSVYRASSDWYVSEIVERLLRASEERYRPEDAVIPDPLQRMKGAAIALLENAYGGQKDPEVPIA